MPGAGLEPARPFERGILKRLQTSYEIACARVSFPSFVQVFTKNQVFISILLHINYTRAQMALLSSALRVTQ